jgi:hypothetical protein
VVSDNGRYWELTVVGKGLGTVVECERFVGEILVR